MAEDGLGTFEGEPVVAATLKITKAGDGLSEALALKPVALHRGDECYFVLRGTVDQVNFRSAKDGEAAVRQHTVVTEEITEVDADDVDHLLKAAADRIKVAREEREGVVRLAFDGEEGEDGTDD